MKKKILAALSGGVDSAVTALLLQNKGFAVEAATLNLCPGAESEIESAAELCRKLGIVHHVLDKRELFRETVMRSFSESYARGETPNPCVECNPKIKFGLLCAFARENDIENVATGHYARCEYSEKYKRRVIRKAVSTKKDQSYVLWKLSREQVDMVVFPMGEFDKDQTRAIAAEHGFSSANKKDSQDICFIKGEDYADFVEKFLGKSFESGNFVTTDGKVLGTHRGIIRYTTGQRKGLGLALPAPLYVKEKRMADNEVVLCPEEMLYTLRLTAKSVNFQAIDPPSSPFRALVKVRYSAKEAPAEISFDGERINIVFDEPQRAVTPGQSAVVYDEDGILLCGGIIDNE